MTRVKYIKIRNLNLLNEIAFAYFTLVIKGDEKMDKATFMRGFKQFYLANPFLKWDWLISEMDLYFKVTTLSYISTGKIVKIY